MKKFIFCLVLAIGCVFLFLYLKPSSLKPRFVLNSSFQADDSGVLLSEEQWKEALGKEVLDDIFSTLPEKIYVFEIRDGYDARGIFKLMNKLMSCGISKFNLISKAKSVTFFAAEDSSYFDALEDLSDGEYDAIFEAEDVNSLRINHAQGGFEIQKFILNGVGDVEAASKYLADDGIKNKIVILFVSESLKAEELLKISRLIFEKTKRPPIIRVT